MFNPPSVADVQAAFADWRIDSYLGKGTYKAAYSARYGNNAEALKLFYVPTFDDDDDGSGIKTFLGRFSREIRLLGECHTASLVKLASLAPMEVTIGSATFIAYSEELLEGETVKDLISRKYVPPHEEVSALLRCLGRAISELWEGHRCVHRDIKPGNIVKRNGPTAEFVLLDLGVSFEADGTRYTAPGYSPGTPAYRAPEMLDVDYADKLDARTDLYCAGVTVFEFASGVHPLGPFTTGSIEGRILNQPPQRLENLRPDLPASVCDVVNRLNRKKTTLRGNLGLLRKELSIQ
jgi:serine/threonine protein kinase